MSIRAETEALKIKEILQQESYIVQDIETKKRTSSPQPPFMTSTLQQSASSSLGFSPKKTMSVAQKLYEGVKTHKGTSGVITYMRTDSLNIAKEAIEISRAEILKTYGKDYLPEKPRYYSTKSKTAQEAHEAIRPTMIDFTPKIAKDFLEPDEMKLYTLIYNRFLASQMTNAVFESQSVIFASSSGKFKANGRKLLFDGFYAIYGENDKDLLLPNLKINEPIKLNELFANQHFTEPPARYSEASLINKLESLGIGRPSTYAPTISILTSRNYITIEKKQLVPSETAFDVTKMLEDNFPNIVDSGFTSIMENDLDLVAEGKKDWQKVLADFYFPFEEQINRGKKDIKSVKISIPTGEICPKCGSDLVIKKGRFGEFTACGAYPKCKFIKKDEKTAQTDNAPISTGEICPKCGGDLVIKKGRFGEFTACGAYPKCKFIKKDEPIKLAVKCPKCGGDIVERKSRRGKFFGCSNYPKCKFVSKTEPKE